MRLTFYSMLVMSSELKSSTTTTTNKNKNSKNNIECDDAHTTTAKKMVTSTAISPAGAEDDDDGEEEEAGVVTHDEDSNMGVSDKHDQRRDIILTETTETTEDQNSTTELDKPHPLSDSNNNNHDPTRQQQQVTATTTEEEDEDVGEPKGEGTTTHTTVTSTAASAASTTDPPAVVVETPLPLLKGTLTYNLESRRHILRGNWNYDYSKTPPSLIPSHKIPPQRFELIRPFPANTPEEEIKLIPSNGEFHGSFSLVYYMMKNGKTRERSKVVPESGVHIQFEPVKDDQQQQQQQHDTTVLVNEFKVIGKGTNQYGEFNMYGKATRSSYEGEQDTFHVEVTKRYVTAAITAAAPAATDSMDTTPTEKSSSKKRSADSECNEKPGRKLKYDDATTTTTTTTIDASTADDEADMVLVDPSSNKEEILPPPSPSFPSGVVCLRGKLFRDKAEQVGVQENLHRIRGLWSTGLDMLLSDPNNERGLCNPFDYEHKSIDEKNDSFPLSGRYTGFFYITNEDRTTTRIPERDVFLKFKPNSAGGYNVEGKGSNIFGKYTISGTMETCPPSEDDDDEPIGTVYLMTIFRHFQPRKVKKEKKSTTSEGPSIIPESSSTLSNNHDSSLTQDIKVTKPEAPELPVLALDQIIIPGLADFVPTEETPNFIADAIVPPEHGSYSAVSRGVLRINADGAHTCGGKWAISREHFANNISSSFNFGLDAHIALEEAKKVLAAQGRLPDGADTALPSDLPVVFPLDSAHYKGNFRLKRGANKFSSFVDKQIVLKFVKNSSGSFNVYGKGCNNIGQFDLIGTLIQQGQSSGQVELYRIYSSTSSSDDRRSSSTSVAAPVKTPEVLVTTTQQKQQQPISNSVGIPALSTNMSDVSTPGAVKTFSPPRRQESEASLTTAASVLVLPSVGSSTTPLVGFQRTESGRSVKLPSRLEDSDPDARKARIMEKCNHILRFLREQDAMTGRFFAEPVDPVALGIPMYTQIIANPMDLGTIQQRMNSGQVEDHEEFARLVRLVFENAMKFNVDPTHSVHVRARDLLVLFNRKFADVERIVSSINEKRRLSKSELKAKQREEKRKEKIAAKEAKRKAKEEKADKKKRQKTEIVEVQPTALTPMPSMEVPSTSQPSAAEGYVAKSDFDRLYEQMHQMQLVIAAMQQQLAALGAPVVPMPTMPLSRMQQPPAALSSSSSPDKNVSMKSKTKGKIPHKKYDEEVDEDEDEELKHKPLSLKEQEQLSDAINRLTGKRLDEAIRIIKESTHISDEGEIDLEIDQLDNPTQRKLQRFVLKTKLNRTKKPPSKTAASKKATSQSSLARDPVVTSAVAPAKSSAVDSFVEPKPAIVEKRKVSKKVNRQIASSFLGFGVGAASDVDESDDGDSSSSSSSDSEEAPKSSKNADGSADSFALPDHSLDMEDDLNDDVIKNKNWDLTVGTAASKGNVAEDSDDDDDDRDTLWGAARMEAEANKQREAERKAREDKVRAQAELESKERLASAQATAEMIRAKRMEEEEEEAKLKELKAREAEEKRNEAREAVRRNVLETKQTVDLDAQRSLMEMYERSIIDSEIGDSASPSYNFGF